MLSIADKIDSLIDQVAELPHDAQAELAASIYAMRLQGLGLSVSDLDCD